MKLVRILLILGVVIGAANFVSFFIISMDMGGDAINGKAENGRFFVANHGKYTEVSESQFKYSRWHGRSVWVTHPVAMLCGLGLYGLRSRETGRQSSNA